MRENERDRECDGKLGKERDVLAGEKERRERVKRKREDTIQWQIMTFKKKRGI